MTAIEAIRARARGRAMQRRSADTSVGEGYGITSGVVPITPEFRRIEALDRVDWLEHADELVELLGEEYGIGDMSLRPLQAAALAAMHDHGGLLAAAGVGSGKTLISFLAPVVLEVDRALLIVPAKLIAKTQRDFAELRRHWKAPKEIKILSYEILGRVQAADEIENYNPELIILDEAHRAKNPRAACTRRILRFLVEHPACKLVALSGTITSRSLRDFSHLLFFALGPDRAPLPVSPEELADWANAVDEEVEARARPGALRFLLDGAAPSLENVRAAVGRRIFETPGVIRASAQGVDASIVVELVESPMPRECRALVRKMLEEKIAPNGDEVLPTELYRHVGTLALGFWYRWDPAPPEVWLEARKRWRRFVRDVLDREDPRYDSELQVSFACRRFEQRENGDCLDSNGAWSRWTEVRSEYKIRSVPVWVSDKPLRRVKPTDPTIVWVGYRSAGTKLSKLSGLRYYHNQGMCKKRFIDDENPSCSLIASIAANAEGRNLQAWSRNEILTPPANGRIWEQLIGRTHRPGQKADEIHLKIRIGHRLLKEQLRKAVQDAKYVEQVTGTPQKLLLSNIESELEKER